MLANPSFGTVISESGMAYTWSRECPRVSSHTLV
ncbi:MAG: hypothetical protein MZV65_16610 [Chromatiales bacterium]|nr:hypothetical protein [Chromatiales bacterium]